MNFDFGGDALSFFETDSFDRMLLEIAAGWGDSRKSLLRVKAEETKEANYVL